MTQSPPERFGQLPAETPLEDTVALELEEDRYGGPGGGGDDGDGD
jgi:hypothetical protein